LTFAQQEAVNKYIVLADVSARKQFGGISRVAGRQSAFPIDDFAVDTSVPGRVSIPKIDVDVTLLWTADFNQVQEDLKYGVVHHPDTVLPGESGTSSLHGHSSGYIWDGDHKTAFTRINFLEAGDEVFVTVQGRDGSTRRYRYLVRYKKVYEADDQAQFSGNGVYNLNISTSWPIGSARQRMVVHTELAGL
jgi:LPXTG-site transpeptidase (sortase) family protein